MNALRNAKAALADTKATTFTADRLKTALRELVEEIEGSPVGRSLGMVVYYDDADEAAAAQRDGESVRLVVEGE